VLRNDDASRGGFSFELFYLKGVGSIVVFSRPLLCVFPPFLSPLCRNLDSALTMPLAPHRRHYSWPFGGPSTNTHEHHQQTDLRFVNLLSQGNRFPSFEQIPEDPLLIGNLYEEDDALSAGIIRSTSPRHSRLWPCGSRKEDAIVSSVTKADELPVTVLRRLIWPRLEKARLYSSVRTADNSVAHGEPEDVMITYASPLHLTKEGLWIGELEEFDKLNDGDHHRRVRPSRERKHRRCHSEQPRSWREPGPGLWTLLEEEPSG